MIYAVYVPLLIPLLVAPFAGPFTARLHPAHAARVLAAVAVVLAACSTVSLLLLAATHWPQFDLTAPAPRLPAGANPTEGPVAAAAALLAGAGAVAAAAVTIMRRRSLRAVRRMCAATTGTTSGGPPLIVVESGRPQAFSVPPTGGKSGMVVVSRTMLDGLDDDERTVLLAHELSHLEHSHHHLIATTRAAALLNPFLWPLLRALRFTVERWADEDAAATTRDRRLTARAVGRAALLARTHGRPSPAVAGGGVLGIAGAVPRRVACLLVPSPPGRWWVTTVGLLAASVALASTVAAAEGVRDLGHLLALWSKH